VGVKNARCRDEKYNVLCVRRGSQSGPRSSLFKASWCCAVASRRIRPCWSLWIYVCTDARQGQVSDNNARILKRGVQSEGFRRNQSGCRSRQALLLEFIPLFEKLPVAFQGVRKWLFLVFPPLPLTDKSMWRLFLPLPMGRSAGGRAGNAAWVCWSWLQPRAARQKCIKAAGCWKLRWWQPENCRNPKIRKPLWLCTLAVAVDEALNPSHLGLLSPSGFFLRSR